MTRWLAALMRRWADRIDYAGAPKHIGWSYTFEDRRGIVFREDGKGCKLWYLGDADQEKAHTEADTAHARVDWKALGEGRTTGVVTWPGGGAR